MHQTKKKREMIERGTGSYAKPISALSMGLGMIFQAYHSQGNWQLAGLDYSQMTAIVSP